MSKVLLLKTYQSVNFDNQEQNFFNIAAEKWRKLELTLDLLPHAIKITTPRDSIVVPFTNIAFYKVDESETKETKSKSSKS